MHINNNMTCAFVLGALLLTTLTIISTTSYYLFLTSCKTKTAERSLTPPQRSPGRTEAVILLTQKRSGSSVVGEIFNQRTDVSYFYEPLLPFPEAPCESLLEDRLQVLQKIVNCRFDLEDHYVRGFNVSKCTDKHARCLEKKICFSGGKKYSQFLGRDAGLCKLTKDGIHQCPSPINMQKLSRHCRQSLLRAMKVIYLCKLEWLVPLLSNRTVNVKIVHLVRDPRATINSRIRSNKSNNRIPAIRHLANVICPKLEENIIFAERVMRNGPLSDQYLRVRHEDFATKPLESTQAVYDYMGINIHPSIKEWLSDALSSENNDKLSIKDSQGTKRNPAVVVTDWRQSLSWNEVLEIQKSCHTALNMLGYRVFENENVMRNLEDNPSFTYELPE